MRKIKHLDDLKGMRLGEEAIVPMSEVYFAKLAGITKSENHDNVLVDFIQKTKEGFERRRFIWNWPLYSFYYGGHQMHYPGKDPFYEIYEQINNLPEATQ